MNFIKIIRSITFFLLVSVQLTFAANYYVDAVNGNDINSGLSPSSAWQTINKVNNFSFASGDVIAFSRGETFTGYTLTPNRDNLTFTSYGNGDLPVIDAQNSLQFCVIWNHKNNITFSYIKFYNGTVECMDVNNANYLTIDSCIFDGNFHEAQTAYIGLSYYTHITKSVFQNAASGGVYKNPHGLYLGGGGYQIVEYSKFLNNEGDGIHINVNVNPDGGVPHPIIRDNWFEGNSQNFQDQASDSLEFYDNVIVDNPNVPYAVGISFSYESAYSQYCVRNSNVFNNTILMNDSNTGHNAIMIYGLSAITNLTFKNNIILFTNSNQGNGYFIYQQAGGGTVHFNNNLFFRTGGSQSNFADLQNNTYNSFSSWQSTGNDANSVWADPLLANVASKIYTLLPGSPAINLGTNLGLNFDYNNNTFPNYRPDVGAFEHPFVLLNTKAFLGGPYNNGSMTTFLNTQNQIPLSQPYYLSPWNYSGAESVSSIPPNIVDWVLVEVRSGTTSNTTISRKAAFLRSDGTLVDLDGVSPIRMDFVNTGNYYIVIRHRNHLEIMSSLPIFLSSSSNLYDFTTSQSQAYGRNPMLDLGNGLFAMYPGDGDSNGGVSSIDRNYTWRLENGSSGYLQGDYNLNGVVDITDLNVCWRENNGTLTQVP